MLTVTHLCGHTGTAAAARAASGVFCTRRRPRATTAHSRRHAGESPRCAIHCPTPAAGAPAAAGAAAAVGCSATLSMIVATALPPAPPPLLVLPYSAKGTLSKCSLGCGTWVALSSSSCWGLCMQQDSRQQRQIQFPHRLTALMKNPTMIERPPQSAVPNPRPATLNDDPHTTTNLTPPPSPAPAAPCPGPCS